MMGVAMKQPRLLFAAIGLIALSGAAHSQNQPTMASGPLTPGHGLSIQQAGTPGSAVTRDAGPAIAGNFTEIGLTNDGLPLCVRDKAQQHLLCLGANALGGGLISYNPVGAGTPQPLQINLNGTSYPFPGTGNGNVVGPSTSVVDQVATWNNVGGSLLKSTSSLSGIALSNGTVDNTPIGGVTPNLVYSTQLINNIQNLVTTNTLGPIPGSVGQGPLYFQNVRTGGFGQYGNLLVNYEITAATPSPQFDTGITSWTTHKNLTGGAVFADWGGANTPAAYKGETYTGGAVVSAEFDYGNRWADLGVQLDVGFPRYTVGLQIVPDVVPATGAPNTTVVGFAGGSPAVFTLINHGFYANMGLSFVNTAGITGISDGTTYYVSASGLTANNFEISATIGGAPINTSGSPSGALSVLPSWPGNFGIVMGASVHGHQTYVQELMRIDSIAPGGYAHVDNGSSVATNQPQEWARIGGHWADGLNFVNATFSSGIAIALGNNQQLNLNGGVVVGGAGGSLVLTTGGSGTIFGSLAGNNFAANSLIWGATGTAPELGFFGTAPGTQPTGYGTPTNVALTANLPGTAATLAEVGGTLAALITNLKAIGLIGN